MSEPSRTFYLISGSVSLVAIAVFAIAVYVGNAVRESQKPYVCAFRLVDSTGATTPAYMRYMTAQNSTSRKGRAVWTFRTQLLQDAKALDQLKAAAEACKFDFEVQQ